MPSNTSLLIAPYHINPVRQVRGDIFRLERFTLNSNEQVCVAFGPRRQNGIVDNDAILANAQVELVNVDKGFRQIKELGRQLLNGSAARCADIKCLLDRAE